VVLNWVGPFGNSKVAVLPQIGSSLFSVVLAGPQASLTYLVARNFVISAIAFLIAVARCAIDGVKAWINNHRYYGVTTTSATEGLHSIVKRWLVLRQAI